MLENILKGGMPETEEMEAEESLPLEEFEGLVECALFTDTCKIAVGKEELSLTGKMDLLRFHYSQILDIRHQGFRICLETEEGVISISHMGQELDWFFEKLWAAYNDAVVEALLAKGECAGSLKGEYTATEGDQKHSGKAVFRIYEDCLCILPSNQNARRLPFCFFSTVEKNNFSLTLTLTAGEQYTMTKLGRELDLLNGLITQHLREQQKKTQDWHKSLAPTLGSMQAAATGKLMPFGRSADWKKLMSKAPPLVAVIEEKLRQSRMAKTWPWLLDLCGGEGLHLGILPTDKPAETEPDDLEEQEPKEPSPILWLLAPNQERTLAAIEMDLGDQEASATYLYRLEGSWETFSAVMERGLEASQFQRDLIRLKEEDLNKPEHLQNKMRIQRTPALQILRKNFAGRAIHTSIDRWKRDIKKIQEENLPHQQANADQRKKAAAFCTNCGSKLFPGVKFCGQCGSPQI